ncbi:MAG: (Fe-S)-binding protein, partial [Gemmatimonadota bacterium]
MIQERFSPAAVTVAGIPGSLLFLLIAVVAIGVFAWVMVRRAAPLRRGAPDARFNRIPERVGRVLKYWLGQWRHPRYRLVGVLHIVVFFGFLILLIRSTELVLLGIFDGFRMPGFGGPLGSVYDVLTEYAATVVLVAVVILAIRRAFFRPSRYAVPEQLGKDHTSEALLVLGLIGTLMICGSLFEASLLAAEPGAGPAPVLTATWAFEAWLAGAPVSTLASIRLAAYVVHDLTFFFFLCLLPFGKHFHVITSIFNVFFMRLDTGTVKPVRHGVSAAGLDDLESFGVKRFEDFTWKHMLDFYSCVDCGRCSDHCPANRVGRPLSPRFISIKARDYAFEHYPVVGRSA